MTTTQRALFTLGCVAAASTLAVLAAGPLAAQEPQFSTDVTSIKSEDLPVGVRLSAFVTRMDKQIKHNSDHARLFFENLGFELSDEEIAALSTLYGDFDESQGVRHQRQLPEVQHDPELVRELGVSFLMERAAYTGTIFGQWLAFLRDQGYDTGLLVTGVLEEFSFTESYGGHEPDEAVIRRRAQRFEASFRQVYGEPLGALVENDGPGVAR